MKCLEQFRLMRQKFCENLFGARALCVTGLLLMPGFLFNPSAQFRAAQFFFFWFLCWLSGRKNNPLITIMVFIGIVFFNLLVPYGEVLFSFGFFKITWGALVTGIQRAVTLTGLVMLSRICIRQDLMLPGVFGRLIAGSFRVLARITGSRQRITGKNFIADIDRLMMDLSMEDDPEEKDSAEQEKKTKAAGFVVLAIVILFSCFLFLTGLFVNSNTIGNF